MNTEMKSKQKGWGKEARYGKSELSRSWRAALGDGVPQLAVIEDDDVGPETEDG